MSPRQVARNIAGRRKRPPCFDLCDFAILDAELRDGVYLRSTFARNFRSQPTAVSPKMTVLQAAAVIQRGEHVIAQKRDRTPETHFVANTAGRSSGRRKTKVHDLFENEGPEAAWVLGMRLRLKESTLRSWFAQWQRLERPLK